MRSRLAAFGRALTEFGWSRRQTVADRGSLGGRQRLIASGAWRRADRPGRRDRHGSRERPGCGGPKPCKPRPPPSFSASRQSSAAASSRASRIPKASMTGSPISSRRCGSKWLETARRGGAASTHVAARVQSGHPVPRRILAVAARPRLRPWAASSRSERRPPCREIDAAVTATAGEPDGGLIVVPGIVSSPRPARATRRSRRCVIGCRRSTPSRVFPANGGCCRYGNDQVDIYRRAATYRGPHTSRRQAGELPVKPPIKFELTIN